MLRTELELHVPGVPGAPGDFGRRELVAPLEFTPPVAH